MIDMFTNYDNLSKHYQPNNLNTQELKPFSYTKLSPINKSKPYELYNAKNELEGYYWYYGNHINLEFSIDGELTMDDDNSTGTFIDAYDFLRDKTITFTLYDFRMNTLYSKIEYGETLSRSRCNAQNEPDDIDYIAAGNASSIAENASQPDSPTFIVCIDGELSKKLVKGIYYCSLEVSGRNYNEILFSPQDCKLLVK